MSKREVTPGFKSKFPQSVALTVAGSDKLLPVSTIPGVEHEGFDEDDVKTALGATRFTNLMATVTNVFSCGHRTKSGVEVHCVYAKDLEAFLKAGG